MLKMYEQASNIQTHLRHSGHSVRTINTLNLNVRFLHQNELANKQRRNNVNGDTEAKSIKTIWATTIPLLINLKRSNTCTCDNPYKYICFDFPWSAGKSIKSSASIKTA